MRARSLLLLAVTVAITASGGADATTIIIPPYVECAPVPALPITASEDAKAFNAKIANLRWQECRIGPDAARAEVQRHVASLSESTGKVCRFRHRAFWTHLRSDEELTPFGLDFHGPWGLSTALMSDTGPSCPAPVFHGLGLDDPNYIATDPRLTTGEFRRITAFLRDLKVPSKAFRERYAHRPLSASQRTEIIQILENEQLFIDMIFRKNRLIWKGYRIDVNIDYDAYRIQALNVFGKIFLIKVERSERV